MSVTALGGTLHMVALALQGPVIVMLLLFICVSIMEVGSILAEFFMERFGRDFDAAMFLEQINGSEQGELLERIEGCKLLKRHKKVLVTVITHDGAAIDALVRQLLSQEEQHYERVLFVTDFIVRLAPMLGLMGTLIPLGPGMIALGQGDTKMLADSLLTAFDTTIAGLATGGVTFFISRIRKMWYEKDMGLLETLISGILEEVHSFAIQKNKQEV